MEITGKNALITGAARRLGKAIALALAHKGANIAVHYNNSADKAEETAAEIRAMGVNACIVQADQGQPAEVERAAREAAEVLGSIDILVNSAAVFEHDTFPEMDLAQWDRHMNVNLRGPFLFVRAVASAMKERGAGKIVNLVDVAAERPWPGYLAYSVSKAGLIALTRGLARALAPEIQVNGIAPGIILAPEDWDPERLEKHVRRIPMRRCGQPDEIADTVLFLIEGPDYITGAILPVDGGQTTR